MGITPLEKGPKITVQDYLNRILTYSELFFWSQHKYYQIQLKLGTFVCLLGEISLKHFSLNIHVIYINVWQFFFFKANNLSCLDNIYVKQWYSYVLIKNGENQIHMSYR